jgi:hypothetical protein
MRLTAVFCYAGRPNAASAVVRLSASAQARYSIFNFSAYFHHYQFHQQQFRADEYQIPAQQKADGRWQQG